LSAASSAASARTSFTSCWAKTGWAARIAHSATGAVALFKRVWMFTGLSLLAPAGRLPGRAAAVPPGRSPKTGRKQRNGLKFAERGVGFNSNYIRFGVRRGYVAIAPQPVDEAL